MDGFRKKSKKKMIETFRQLKSRNLDAFKSLLSFFGSTDANELKAFSQFGSDLDASTRRLLDRGARLTELLKQGQYSPLTVPEQVVSIYSGVNGYLDSIAVTDISSFESETLSEINEKHYDLLESINKEKELSKENDEKLKSFFEGFLERFTKK